MKKDLWKTKDIKKSGRNILKNNFSTLVMVSLFLTLIFGGSIGNRTGYSVFTEAFEQIQNVQNISPSSSNIINTLTNSFDINNFFSNIFYYFFLFFKN